MSVSVVPIDSPIEFRSFSRHTGALLGYEELINAVVESEVNAATQQEMLLLGPPYGRFTCCCANLVTRIRSNLGARFKWQLGLRIKLVKQSAGTW